MRWQCLADVRYFSRLNFNNYYSSILDFLYVDYGPIKDCMKVFCEEKYKCIVHTCYWSKILLCRLTYVLGTWYIILFRSRTRRPYSSARVHIAKFVIDFLLDNESTRRIYFFFVPTIIIILIIIMNNTPTIHYYYRNRSHRLVEVLYRSSFCAINRFIIVS